MKVMVSLDKVSILKLKIIILYLKIATKIVNKIGKIKSNIKFV